MGIHLELQKSRDASITSSRDLTKAAKSLEVQIKACVLLTDRSGDESGKTRQFGITTDFPKQSTLVYFLRRTASRLDVTDNFWQFSKV